MVLVDALGAASAHATSLRYVIGTNVATALGTSLQCSSTTATIYLTTLFAERLLCIRVPARFDADTLRRLLAVVR